MSKYPQHEKIESVVELSRAQGEFIAWLQNEKGIKLAQYRLGDADERYPARQLEPCVIRISNLLAEFHGIDLQALEREKCEMLEEMRKVMVKQ
jgi:hypothetical protein